MRWPIFSRFAPQRITMPPPPAATLRHRLYFCRALPSVTANIYDGQGDGVRFRHSERAMKFLQAFSLRLGGAYVVVADFARQIWFHARD